MFKNRSKALSAWVGALLLSGCYGGVSSIGGGDGASGVDGGTDGPSGSPGASSGADPGGEGEGGSAGPGGLGSTDPGWRPLRRLNTIEYNNTLRDLFETDVALPSTFPTDEQAAGFDNNAVVQSLTDVHLDHYRNTVRAAVEGALRREDPPDWLVCDPSGGMPCVRLVLEEFVPLAFRRPARPEEVEGLAALADAISSDGGTPEEATAYALEAATLSPKFLFMLEVDPTGDGEARPLGDWELASRLSYFLWSSMPDAALFEAASEGSLQSDEGLSAQVERMLADPKADALVDGFAAQWLPIRTLEKASPDPSTFPDFDDGLRAAMAEETRMFVSDLLFGGRAARELLLSDATYVNDRLADHYGFPAPGSEALVPVDEIGAQGRRGILTQASFLTAYAKPTETSPVLRGHWILDHLLCIEVPPPPPDVAPEPSPIEGQTRRERLATHRENDSCAGCHLMMDPMGLALETYDGIGRFRETEAGLPIVVADELPDGRTFDDALELSELIADDPRFPRCVAQHLFVYALGRDVQAKTMDREVLDAISSSFIEEGYSMQHLIEQIVLSPSFRTRRGEGEA